MASAVLANRSESNWPQQTKSGGARFMGKVSFPTTKPNPKSNPASNPNARFNKKQRQSLHHDDAEGHVVDDMPTVTHSAASDDASSINRKLNDFTFGSYVSFNISSCTRKELIDLKNRLLAELEQIRELKIRIESNDFLSRSVTSKKPTAPKKISGTKRSLPTNFGKDLKRLSPQENGKAIGNWAKSCGQILTKLMKQKHGYIFNSPVDVVALGLHDYYDIIKNPMDLGTVKSRMSKNFYGSPSDFAADVRLTFKNAMLYNPKGHEVYVLAEQLLSRFEELFRPVSERLQEQEESQGRDYYEEELQGSSWDQVEADRGRREGESYKDPDRGDDLVSVVGKLNDTGGALGSGLNQTVVGQREPQVQERMASPFRAPQGKPVKLPKPKAKDPNKREMSMEEKHKLGLGLQSLPQEKMENVLQIIRKRNGHLRQEGDEIELDIGAVDTETLWELDRFVTNYKKMVSKIKRQALMGNNVVAIESKQEVVVEKMEVPTETKKIKKGEAGEEDVDIGDEMPLTSFPPVEIVKDNERVSSSSSDSSSSSSDSSSSDSDSGSSSGSDSDEDARS